MQSILRRILGKPDRRRHARNTATVLELRIDGHKYETIDWSLGGFRFSGFHKDVRRRDNISGTIGGVGAGPGEFVAEVMRVSDNGDVSVRLLEITPATFLAMGGLREI